jgi:hypothetical protein
MASWPTLSVRVAFASVPFASSPTWTELGPASGAGPGGFGWVRQIACKRGRERLLRSQAQFQAGTLVCNLDNRDRRFDPTNTASPYAPDVLPELLVQVGATLSSTFYPIWTGYIDDWPQSWPGMSEAECALKATDLFKHLSIMRILSNGYELVVQATPGLEAFYELDDPIGSTTAADSSGNGLTAPVYGAPSYGSVLFGSANLIPSDSASSVEIAAGGAIQIPSGALAGVTDNITFEFIFNAATTPGNINYLIDFGDAGGQPYNIGISGLGKIFVHAGGQIAIGATTVNDGNPHHVIVSYTSGPSAWEIAVYVDEPFTDALVSGSGALANWPVQVGYIANYLETDLNLDTIAVQDVSIYSNQMSGLNITKHLAFAGIPAQYTGQMITQLLTILGFPSNLQAIDTGKTWCQADTQDETQTKLLDQFQKLEQTEQGQLFMSAAGKLVFQDRYHRYKSPDNVSQVTIDDLGTNPSFSMGGLATSFDRAELYNDIPVTRRNGNLQEASNAASITQYTNRTMTGLSDLMMATDADALACAEWILADTAYPELLISDLVLDPVANPALWPYVLGLDIGAVVTVKKSLIPGGGAPIDVAVRIEGIEHQIDPPRSWKVTWHVSVMGTLGWCIYNDPVAGFFDQGYRWGR